MLDAARNSWPRASGQIADSDRGSNSAQIIFHSTQILNIGNRLKPQKSESIQERTFGQTN